MAPPGLRIGFVPEHFSTPLHFAQRHCGLDAALVPFASGTGHMIAALRAGDIDAAIGLTEGWIAGLGREGVEGDGGYRLVGTYVETPLCWAISTGAERADVTSVDALEGGRMGVSRLGSGSHVMGFVLAEQHGWRRPYADTVVLDTIDGLRRGVGSGAADFFLWEHFTTKKHYDTGELRRVGQIYTPWSSWKIVASTRLARRDGAVDGRVADLLARLDAGVRHFEAHADEAVRHIVDELGYSEADAREWLTTVRFAARTEGVAAGVVADCVAMLRRAGVLEEGKGMEPADMVVRLSGG